MISFERTILWSPAERMMLRQKLSSVPFALLILLSAASAGPCNPGFLPDPLTLRADQLTVLISGYSERRLPLLGSLAYRYASHPAVASVLVLWGNPSTPSAVLRRALPSAGESSAPVAVVRSGTDSLNERFLPRDAIRTRAVAVCDDDLEVDPASLGFAFAVWRSRQDSLVGFFARSHDLDLTEERTWIYTVHPGRYSIVLTKFMILKTEYLRRYSCGRELREARALVDGARNCEDILMNFVAAAASGAGPVLVEGKRVRDWGDPRNTAGNGSSTSDEEIRRVGLSSIADHRKRRGECIREFHRMMGRMPLRYSYGKVVEGVGEQALCRKGGKLVPCDHHH